MIKNYFFTIKVTTHDSRKEARLAILSAFADRSPDGCEFEVQEMDSAIQLAKFLKTSIAINDALINTLETVTDGKVTVRQYEQLIEDMDSFRASLNDGKEAA